MRQLVFLGLNLLAIACGRGEPRAVAGRETAEDETRKLIAELRLPDGEIEGGALFADSLVLVRLHPDLLLIYGRLTGTRTRLGRHGAGPGEFRQLAWSQVVGSDTVLAYDMASRRGTSFSTSGRVLGTWSLNSLGGTPLPLAAYETGSLLVLLNAIPSPRRGDKGLVTDSSTLLFLSFDATPLAPGRRSAMRQIFLAGDGAVRSIEVPLGLRTHVAPTRTGFYLGRSDTTEVRFFTSVGREENRFWVQAQRRAVTAEATARLRHPPSATRNSLRLNFADLYEATPIASVYPLFGRLLADQEGRLWVQDYLTRDDEVPVWTVYSRSGQRLGIVRLPSRSRLMDATGEELLVVQEAEDGDESMRILSYVLR